MREKYESLPLATLKDLAKARLRIKRQHYPRFDTILFFIVCGL